MTLTSSRSRNAYAKQDEQTCGISEKNLQAILNSLCAKRQEEVVAAQTTEENPEEDDSDEEVAEEEINRRIGEPGVLDRLVDDMGIFSRVVREKNMLKLLALVSLSAQLDLLPNGKPIGANIIITAGPGRGKNYLCDAVANVLPESFYFAFESASAKSLYYMAGDDPAFLKHRWAYPNEAEATDLLVEMFRPLLSGGSARHITVNKDAQGRNTGQEFTIEGPITITIPTVRNKLDSQLQSRTLVAELEDYEGRVADHSAAVSGLLSRDYVGTDYTDQIRAWQAALRSLTGIRRVVVPEVHPDFRFDSDQVSHGARLWSNVLGLMCAHAWLEQKNRNIVELRSGEKAIEATPEDYEAAYEVFKAACERSVINISDTHRKILNATYDLREENGDTTDWFGFSQRKIADRAGVAQSTISDNKTYLVKSVKFMTETADGKLNIVDGADPSWWERGDALDGFPKPEQVKVWWADDPLASSQDEPVYHPVGHDDRVVNADDREGADHANGLRRPTSAGEPEDIGNIGESEASEDDSSIDDPLKDVAPDFDEDLAAETAAGW